jgi:hypothetical protein
MGRAFWVGLVLAVACAPARYPSPSLAGRYEASIETRGGGCCSESCGAHSIVARVTLDFDDRGGARARWTRVGCTVTESGGEGPRVMAYDPGAPEQLCVGRAASGGGRRDVHRLDGERSFVGSWRAREGAIDVELEDDATPGRSWKLSCSDEMPKQLANPVPEGLLACTVEGTPWEDSVGLAIRGVLYVDDRPGLSVSSREGGLWGDDGVRFEYRERRVETR